jgi:hypothetical protein
MAYQSQPPQPTGDRWVDWATRLNTYLNRIRTQLQHKDANESAEVDGIFLYDPQLDQCVVSVNGVWRPLGFGSNAVGSYGAFYTNVEHDAGTINTATAITWEGTGYSNGIAIDGTTTSRINFTNAGTYAIDFSAELHSENSSAKKIWIWPRINGTDVPNSTIVTTLTSNDDRIVVSRAGMFTVSAGDYLEAVFAVDDVDLDIHGTAATAFAPASPSATISIFGVA